MRWVGTIALAWTAGCSLLVSTNGFVDGSAPAGVTPEGGAPTAAAGVDATTTPPPSNVEGGVPDAGPGSTELPGLVGRWLFDDGTANDTSGKGHHGLLLGAAQVADTTRGPALVLTAGKMTVSSLDGAAFPRSGTLSIRFRWSEMVVADDHILFDEWDPARHHVMLRHANNAPAGEIQFELMPRSDPYVAGGEFETPKDDWQHIVASWDEEKRRASWYLNGKLVEHDPYDKDFAPTEQVVTIGTNLRGAVDDIRLFDRALTDDEATSLP